MYVCMSSISESIKMPLNIAYKYAQLIRDDIITNNSYHEGAWES